MDLEAAKYVSITTRKRSGDTVSSPVWIAALGEGKYGFTTGSTSGKVKRIRNFPDVELRPCDARGRVTPGATAVLATARVVTGDAYEPVHRAIKSKYGLQFTLIDVFGRLKALFTKDTAADCGIVLQIQN